LTTKHLSGMVVGIPSGITNDPCQHKHFNSRGKIKKKIRKFIGNDRESKGYKFRVVYVGSLNTLKNKNLARQLKL
jgi:hypothetical protein